VQIVDEVHEAQPKGQSTLVVPLRYCVGSQNICLHVGGDGEVINVNPV